MAPAILGTKGGIRTDVAGARYVDDGSIIEGLRRKAMSAHLGDGTHLTLVRAAPLDSAMTFGYLAALHTADQAKEELTCQSM